MLTGSTFYRSAAERQSRLKRVSSKAAGKKGVTEGEMRRQTEEQGGVTSSLWCHRLPVETGLFAGFFTVSFSQTFQTVRQWQWQRRQATHSSYCSQPAFRSPLRLALLATSRERERGRELLAAQQLKQDSGRKRGHIDNHRLDRWKDRHLAERKMGTKWNNPNETESTNEFLKSFCGGNLPGTAPPVPGFRGKSLISLK